MKKRKSNTGTAIELKDGRKKNWIARLTIGYNNNGGKIVYDIDSFEEELQALVCLENYHSDPFPLEIKESKYIKIVSFPKKPYPLVAVENINNNINSNVIKENYTFKQMYIQFAENKLLTKEEIALEKKHHTRPENKPFGRHYCHAIKTAFNNSKHLHDKIYKDLRASDFMTLLKESGKSKESQRIMTNLYMNLDKYALEEDLIQKGYAQFIPNISTRKKIARANDLKTDKTFSYDEIRYLWDFKTKSTGLKEHTKKERELFIRDFWLILLYTRLSCR